MTEMWGLHNDKFAAPTLVTEGYVSIGWDRIDDLRLIGDDQAAVKVTVQSAYPHNKPGAIPVVAGVLRRFAFTAAVGDYVIAPNKKARTLNFGRISGSYEFHSDEPTHRHRRRVEWLRIEVPRSSFSQPALYEVGSAVTMFRVSRHAGEFLKVIHGAELHEQLVDPEPEPETGDAVDFAEDEPSAAKMEQYTQDFVLKSLISELSHEDFEHFTADLLRAMGYQARVTQYVADGGVDVLVHKDHLGLEPGLIKVQCKHTSASHGNSEVNQLAGTLGHGEVGLFATLGSFSGPALAIERQRSDIRLMSGAEIVELTLEHYERLPSKWRNRVPLRRVYVVDRDNEGY